MERAMMMGHELLPAVMVAAYIWGLVGALLAGLRLSVHEPAEQEKVSGRLFGVFQVALIPLVLLGGFVTDYAGVRWVLIGAPILIALAVFGLSMTQSHGRSLGWVVLTAAGVGCLGPAVLKVVPSAFFEGNTAASFNLGFVFVGLGAATAPVLADALIRRLGARRTLGVLAVICLIPAPAALLTPRATFPDSSAGPHEWGFSPNTSVLWLIGTILMFYILLEGGLSKWLFAYLRDLGHADRRIGIMQSSFWFMFLASRLAISLVQQTWLPEGSESWVVVLFAVLATVLVGNMAGSQNATSAMWGSLALGVFLGPILPTLISILFKEFPLAEQGRAYGATFAIGATGGLALCSMAGAYARRRPARLALRLALATGLALACLAVVLGLLF
jgi:fucose permease